MNTTKIEQFKKLCHQWKIYDLTNDDDENVKCDVCLDGDVYDDDDQLVICDGCNSATHQSCYGNHRFIHNDLSNSEEPWLCQRCAYLYEKMIVGNDSPIKESANPSNETKCEFCPDPFGIMGHVQFTKKNS